VHVELAIRAEEVVAEDAFAEFIAGNHLAGQLRESGHELKFDRGQRDGAAIVAHEAGARIHFEVAENCAIGRGCGGGIGWSGRSPTQDGVDTRSEFARVEGLGEVVIGADFQADDAVHVVTVCGEHDDGDGGGCADLAENFEAAHAGEHHVENDQGIGAGESAAEADTAVMDGLGAQALRNEVFRDEFAQLDIVIHDQNAGVEHRGCIVRRHRKRHRACHHGRSRNRGEGTRLTILDDFGGGATGSRQAMRERAQSEARAEGKGNE
jgi:hypothetical protein